MEKLRDFVALRHAKVMFASVSNGQLMITTETGQFKIRYVKACCEIATPMRVSNELTDKPCVFAEAWREAGWTQRPLGMEGQDGHILTVRIGNPWGELIWPVFVTGGHGTLGRFVITQVTPVTPVTPEELGRQLIADIPEPPRITLARDRATMEVIT